MDRGTWQTTVHVVARVGHDLATKERERIINDAEYLFMCLTAICRPFLGKYPFQSLAHFVLGLYLFLTLSCTSCLYVLEMNSLWVSLVANLSPVLRVVPVLRLGFPL